MFGERRNRPPGWLLTFVVLAFLLACNVANEVIKPDSEPTATAEPAVATEAVSPAVSTAVGLTGAK